MDWYYPGTDYIDSINFSLINPDASGVSTMTYSIHATAMNEIEAPLTVVEL